MAESLSTAPPRVPRERLRWARTLRRAFFALVTAVMVAALLGVFGAREGVATANGEGYELEVEYPRTSRAGLAAGLTVTLRRPGGFPAPVTLAFASDYFDSFDVNGVDPEPLGSTSTADRQLSLFEVPADREEMAVSFDARIQPGAPFTRARGSVSVVQEGRDVVTVEFETLVLP